VSCISCGLRLGYIPELSRLTALEPDGDNWRALADETPRRFCANAAHDACNWLIPVDSTATHCLACRHNRTIPDLSDTENVARWRKLERAKHFLFYSLVRFRLPLNDRKQDPEHGLAFDFLAETPESGPVLTGHADGVITVNIREADDSERERARGAMHETYRTLLGHFRHEIGHYYWNRLVRDAHRIEPFRKLFGDESRDYAAALQEHYASPPTDPWNDRYVSSYAAAHPWEDFAETWAHYFHIADTLETARAFGLKTKPRVRQTPKLDTALDFDPYKADSAEDLVESWLPIAFAVNSMNRSMGQPDLYPFVLSPTAIAKLDFVHGLIHR
jgi:hypothetical protein